MGDHNQTEGGEALPLLEPCRQTPEEIDGQPGKRWYALWTHSHCEQLVNGQLAVRGFELFLPMIGVWSRRDGVKYRIHRPLFPGYLFLRDHLTASRYIEVQKARGLVGVLGGRRDGPNVIPDTEIDAIRTLVRSELPVSPYPYLRTGQRVRITEGPLADVEGILIDRRAAKGLLVLSVHLFRRSVAVEIDSSLAVAA